MFIQRRTHHGRVELWECEWEGAMTSSARKVFLRRIGFEQPLKPYDNADAASIEAICWSYGRTLGNIAVFSQEMMGSFHAKEGTDARLVCDFVAAGKFRHGADRWWCRTHQTHWGTKADLQAANDSGTMICANHTQLMNYVVDPFQLKLDAHKEVGIWCSLPAALSSGGPVPKRAPRIHVHVRESAGGKKTVDSDFAALSLHYNAKLGLFDNTAITKVNVTPPAAFEFLRATVEGRELDCVSCSNCGYPHLDLGEFALKPHKKHFCGNCGRDSTWSKEAICSTPLKPLHDQFASGYATVEPDRELNLDAIANCQFVLWASTPAILWTADRPQEVGIHAHVAQNGKRVVDDTFRSVTYDGRELNRDALLKQMIDWRDLFLWDLVAEPFQLSLPVLHASMAQLAAPVRKIIFGADRPDSHGRYTREDLEREQTIEMRDLGTLDAFMGMLGLAREGELINDDQRHGFSAFCAFEMFPRVVFEHPHLHATWEELYGCIALPFWSRIYLENMHLGASIDVVREKISVLQASKN